MKAKKFLAGIMSLNLCLTAAACGNKEEESSSAEKQETTTAETVPDETSAAEETTEENTEAKSFNTEKTFWKANVPDTLKEDEEYSSEDETYSSHTFKALDSEGNVERSVKISIVTEDALDFRQDIVNWGIDLREYADGKLETKDLSGYEFAKAEYQYWGELETALIARNEGAQMSVTITVSGDYNSEDIQSLINSLVFTLPEGSETDAPYPWDGEPIIAETGTAEIESYSLTAQQLIASESILPNNIFDNRIVTVGNTMYALSDYHLYIFNLDGTEAALQETIELEDDYDHMSADDRGNVYISAFYSPLLVYRDGKQVDAPELENQLAVSRDGSFGIEYFTSADDISKVIIKEDGTVEKEDLSISSDLINLVSDIFITKDYILMSGSAADDSGHKLFVFDHSGNHLHTLGDENGESLGSITGAVQTDNGILAIDGNMRSVILWDNDGKFIGEADDGELFGTDYPWISGLYQSQDGNIYVSMVEERPDQSWDEMIMFRLDSNF